MKKFFALILIYSLFAACSYAKDIRFVQVSDVRYTKNAENNCLKPLINDINKQKNINFVIFTGDNIQKPDRDDLKVFLNNIKKLKKPCYLVIGDKDVNKHKKLSKKDYVRLAKNHMKNKSPNYVFENGGVMFFVVDGAKDVFPSTMGYYKDDILEWVDANLDLYSNKNVIIFQHFPLIPPNSNEGYMTYKPEKYLEILAKHKNVKAVISGHFGVNKEQVYNDINHISTAPAPYYRIIDISDCDTENPTIWAEVKEVN